MKNKKSVINKNSDNKFSKKTDFKKLSLKKKDINNPV